MNKMKIREKKMNELLKINTSLSTLDLLEKIKAMDKDILRNKV